jgi:dienelactone hydrolase
VATLAAVLVAVSVVAPAVAATAVPDTVVTTTPAAHGLTYESVTVTTADGVDLAAWYVPGTNGAGVVVAHGAGSTRSSVLDEAAVLARAGYALVLVDARGHGDSGGTAMDFGWYGDLDLTAATAYLAARPDVDADRIGVVGFSMGGEQAVGAAAADARIRAVVAEGATARQAADKAWLSDVYGWRGWVQEQLERVQYGVADYLTEASPPTVLRDAVAKAQDAQFLLIAAGTMDDEEHAASFIREGASDRVAVWTVAGAAPAGGYEAQPDAWERRVVGFLDANLG